MKKSIQTTSIRVKYCIVFICLLSPFSFSRPFDWQYNYVSTPFAIFYNPSLIGNNAGYAFGLDARYLNREDYDGRLAVVVPVGGGAERGDVYGNNEGYDYLTLPYMFGRNAVSVGGMYTSDTGGKNYFASAGFTSPIYKNYLIRGGASVDFASDPSAKPLTVSFNAAVSAPVAGSNLASLTVHNFLVNKWDYGNRFGLSTGAAGILYSNPEIFSVPYDFQFSFYFGGGKVERTEGIARLSFDLTPMLAGRERTGQAVTVSGGYGFVNHIRGELDGKIYAALGVVFINRASSAAAWGGYGWEDGNYGAFMYNLSGGSAQSLFADEEFSAALTYAETDSGQIVFTLDCRGTNIESWVLRIDGLGGKAVRTFSGGNVVPATILWDRLDSEGNPLRKNEPVHARLIVKRRNGAAVEGKRVGIASRE